MNDYYNFINLESYCKTKGIDYDSEWLRWYQNIVGIGLEEFSYKGLPPDCPAYVPERALMFRNFLCWYKNDGMDYPMLCVWVPGDKWNYYCLPEYVNIMSLSGKTIATHVKFDELILVKDNISDLIPFLVLNSYIEKVIELERTLFINVQLLRLPQIFTCDKKSVTSIKAMFKKIGNFEPFVIGDKALADSLQTTNIELPASITDMYDMIENYYKLALSTLGIATSKDKTERLIVAEIQAGNDFSNLAYQEKKECRQDWVNAYNKKWAGTIGASGNTIEKIDLIERYTQINKDNTADEVYKTKRLAQAEEGGENDRESKSVSDNL